MADPTWKMITITCTDGSSLELPDNTMGLDTGFGFVCNPYFIPEGELGADEYHRFKDGDTVVGCPADHPRATPIADAYQTLYNNWEYDRAEWEEGYNPKLIQPEPKALTQNPFANLVLK